MMPIPLGVAVIVDGLFLQSRLCTISCAAEFKCLVSLPFILCYLKDTAVMKVTCCASSSMRLGDVVEAQARF